MLIPIRMSCLTALENKKCVWEKNNRMQLKVISGEPASKVKPAHRELELGGILGFADMPHP